MDKARQTWRVYSSTTMHQIYMFHFRHFNKNLLQKALTLTWPKAVRTRYKNDQQPSLDQKQPTTPRKKNNQSHDHKSYDFKVTKGSSVPFTFLVEYFKVHVVCIASRVNVRKPSLLTIYHGQMRRVTKQCFTLTQAHSSTLQLVHVNKTHAVTRRSISHRSKRFIYRIYIKINR